jgi:triacylglycerol esterase/lipase EstA (alpha/beta hydrolase family)
MRRLAAAGVSLCALVVCTPAHAIIYAPTDQPGPALDVPAAQLAQSMRCTSNEVTAEREVVLFIPPTLVNPDEAWFGYERAFDALGIPYCTVTIPHFTTIDIQISAEYTVDAIRSIHRLTGRKVQLLGWSQGAGPEPRWALRFWPDIRPMVDDLVGLEAPNHGAVAARAVCAGPSCVPALIQQEDGSEFIKALNSRQESFPSISYTNVYSHTSQFVQPNLDDTGTTSLHGGGGQITNVATQDICPLNTADHLAYYYDPVAYALTIDALSNPGPANPARIDRGVCAQQSMPYVPFSDVPSYSVHLYNALFLDRLQNQPKASAEPPLKCYVTATCPAASGQSRVGASTQTKSHRRLKQSHRVRHRRTRRHKAHRARRKDEI